MQIRGWSRLSRLCPGEGCALPRRPSRIAREPVTLGNIVGGAGFVGAIYRAIYRAAFGMPYQREK
jgi:hypothetical protein